MTRALSSSSLRQTGKDRLRFDLFQMLRYIEGVGTVLPAQGVLVNPAGMRRNSMPPIPCMQNPFRLRPHRGCTVRPHTRGADFITEC